MKTTRTLLILLCSALCLMLVACGGGGGGGSTPPSSMVIITTSSLPNGIVNQEYSATLQAAGGSGAYTWSVTSGSLPPGLSLSTSGSITQKPTAAGSYVFTVQVTSGTRSATATLSITVFDVLTVATSSLPYAFVGVSYYQTLLSGGGTGPQNWSVTNGSLPAGLTLTADGTITGTPTAPGTSSFRVQVNDGTQTATKDLQIAVKNQLVINPLTVEEAIVNQPYALTPTASGGSGPITWSVIGTLPPGLTINPTTGAIAGTPTTTGEYSLTLRATDGDQVVETWIYLQVVDVLTIPDFTAPHAKTGTSYVLQIVATGGTVYNRTWTISAGSLPPGLSLWGGQISGKPTQAGTFSFTVKVVDGKQTATKDGSITVDYNVAITTDSLPSGRLNQPYSQALTAAYNTGTVTWSLASGSLPNGLTLSTDGTISGTPTSSGSFYFTVQAQDSATSITKQLYLWVDTAPAITTTSLPAATYGEVYSTTIMAAGGTPPYTWSTTSTLPDGLSLSSAGVLNGIPNSAGSYWIYVTVTDSASVQAGSPFLLTVNAPLTITTTTLPDARTNTLFDVQFKTTPTTSQLTWSGTNLPSGMTLDPATGSLTWTPTSTGSFPFTVQVQDTGGHSASKDFTLNVVATKPRNNSIPDATPLTNGSWTASISPYADAPTGPDTDYYKLTALGGATVHVEIIATGANADDPLDSVIEIVDANGQRYSVCRDPYYTYAGPPVIPDATPDAYDDMCMNDDKYPGNLDSMLDFRVPGTLGTPLTFYVHVFDWSGNARPDMVYQISISGVQ
jgi:hypothetical protein